LEADDDEYMTFQRIRANKCQITEDIFSEKLNELGFFQALVDYHNDKQKETGLSRPIFGRLAELCENKNACAQGSHNRHNS
jgi:hypothetical protein